MNDARAMNQLLRAQLQEAEKGEGMTKPCPQDILQKQLSYASGRVEHEILKHIIKLQSEQGKTVVREVHPGAAEALDRWNQRSFSLNHAMKVRRLQAVLAQELA